MFVAVAWLRGALPDVVLGEIDREHLQRVLAATAAESIARILGKTEMDMFLDLDQYLTEDEKHMIGGD
jgi:hypothetical protein